MKTVNDVSNVPAAIGPYSQGVITGKTLFLSGQIPVDPQTGNLVEGDITEQTQQVMRNIQSLLEHQGLGLGNLVKTTIFLSDMGHFRSVNQIYGEWLGEHRPARATVQVAGLPLGAFVEIEAIAELP